ncbi:MAG TPA: CDGSH iron-sulfur domain-containing protein [Paludibacter sp.]|nr:CDGSH iron-sulfur domain-containing protein [Paludibacter sp.]
MKRSNYISVYNAKANFSGLSGYFKLDLPTGKDESCAGKAPICQCGRSLNKPSCDGSHAKCVDGMICPWF